MDDTEQTSLYHELLTRLHAVQQAVDLLEASGSVRADEVARLEAYRRNKDNLVAQLHKLEYGLVSDHDDSRRPQGSR